MSITAALFILFFFSGLVLAFIKHPIYGVYSYLLVLYMGPGEVWWSENIPDLRWSLLAAFFTVIAAFIYPAPTSRPPWYNYAPIQWLIIFSLWLWLQALWALSLNHHLFLAFLFTKYILLYIILYLSFTDQAKIKDFFFAHILGCFYWGLLAYQNPGSGRLEKIGFGDLAGSAFASMQISTGLAFAGFTFLFISDIKKWIAFCSIPFLLNAIILMATRGAFLGLVGGSLAALLFSPKSKRHLIIICLMLAAVLLTYLSHDLFWERMITILPNDSTGTLEESAASRIDIALANLMMFQDYPLGVGHRGNDLLSPFYMPAELLTPTENGENIRSAHNTLMATLVDHSLVGLILIILFHLSIVRSLIELKYSELHTCKREIDMFIGAFGVSLVIYWANAQFANFLKAEVVIWIAAMTAALEWMTKSRSQPLTNKLRCKTMDKLTP